MKKLHSELRARTNAWRPLRIISPIPASISANAAGKIAAAYSALRFAPSVTSETAAEKTEKVSDTFSISPLTPFIASPNTARTSETDDERLRTPCATEARNGSTAANEIPVKRTRHNTRDVTTLLRLTCGNEMLTCPTRAEDGSGKCGVGICAATGTGDGADNAGSGMTGVASL